MARPPASSDSAPLRERRRRRPASGVRWLVALGLALLGHVAMLALIVGLSSMESGEPRVPSSAPPTSVNMRTLSPEAWAKNRGELRPALPTPANPTVPSTPVEKTAEPELQRPEEKKPEKREEEDKRRPTAHTAPGNDEVPDDSKFAAETNNRVEKETRARETSTKYKIAQPKTTTTSKEQSSGEKSIRAGNEGLANADTPKQDAKRTREFKVPDVKKREEIALKPSELGDLPGAEVTNQSGSEAVKGNSDRLAISPGEDVADEAGSEGRAGGTLTLTPSNAVLDKIAGTAPSQVLDSDDIEEGDGTYLNTREWKHATFFNRIYQGVSNTWEPLAKLRQRDPTGEIYGSRERYTLVVAKLNDRGYVKEVWVEKSSGLDFLDLEAIQAFERAQPFPNPPLGIRNPDGTTDIRFGFIVSFDRPGLHLFRRR